MANAIIIRSSNKCGCIEGLVAMEMRGQREEHDCCPSSSSILIVCCFSVVCIAEREAFIMLRFMIDYNATYWFPKPLTPYPSPPQPFSLLTTVRNSIPPLNGLPSSTLPATWELQAQIVKGVKTMQAPPDAGKQGQRGAARQPPGNKVRQHFFIACNSYPLPRQWRGRALSAVRAYYYDCSGNLQTTTAAEASQETGSSTPTHTH